MGSGRSGAAGSQPEQFPGADTGSKACPSAALNTVRGGACGGGANEAPFARVTRLGRAPEAASLQVSQQTAPDDVAAQLDVLPGTNVISRQYEYLVDGAPWALLTAYYPPDLVTPFTIELVRAEGIPGGAASDLEQRLGLVQVGNRERIAGRPADGDEAKFLELPGDGSATVLTVMHTRFGPRPFQVTTLVVSAERNGLVINSRQVPGNHSAPAVT
jgi:DNA-binding GntR family transcriptional regulator